MATEFITSNPEETPLISTNSSGESKQLSRHSDSNSTLSPSSDILGYIYLFLTGCILAISASMARVVASRYTMPVSNIVFIRSIVHIPLALGYTLALSKPRRALASLKSSQILLLIFRGIMGASGLFLFYAALKRIRSGDAVALFCLSPAFTLLLSRLILKEPTTIIDIISVVFSFFGAWLISRPSNSVDVTTFLSTSASTHINGCMLAIVSALCASSAYVTVRALGMSISFMLSVLALAIANMIMALSFGGYATMTQLVNTYGHTAVLLAVVLGFTSFVSQVTLNLGFQNCKAGRGNVVFTIEVPITYLISIVILHESPKWSGILGASLIAGATVSVCFQEFFNSNSSN